ncbi:hypothetical protein, partial [uncultured Roseobacter sp.]|uniref:hypothetical protein n=1 Tax=uncultured Roseobacter sp. TaxID=114847 RepID=UPI00260ACA79
YQLPLHGERGVEHGRSRRKDQGSVLNSTCMGNLSRISGVGISVFPASAAAPITRSKSNATRKRLLRTLI